ncbi:MAG: sensor histidine kinase [Mycobacteriales bacterium]
MSLRARIACIVALLVGLTVALTSGVAYFTVRGEVYHQVDLDLIAQAGRAKTLRPEMLVSPDANVLLGAADLRIALLVQDPHDGDVTAVSSPKQTPPISVRERQVAEGSRDSSLRTTSWHGDRYRVVATPAPSGYTIVLARPLAPTDRTLARLAWVIFLTGGAGILLAAAAGLAVTRAGLRPVERLTAKAEHVAHTGDLTPIEVTGRDELARLTASFNTMLDAVAKAQARQRQLVADASHELRTPMTSLRTNLDLLAQASTEGGLSELDRNELVADVRAQLEELSGLVNDLVELAREEPPQYSAEPVELSDVASRSVERVRRRAPGLKYDLDLRPWVVLGEPQILERAVTNLVDNAAKWSPEGGTITIKLINGTLSVADEGRGIADEDLPRVFDRFYRSAEARALPGSGLGLAIVKQAVERHGGWVAVGHAPGGGALFSVWLPGTASEQHAS